MLGVATKPQSTEEIITELPIKCDFFKGSLIRKGKQEVRKELNYLIGNAKSKRRTPIFYFMYNGLVGSGG